MRKRSAVPLALAAGCALLATSAPSYGAVKGRAAPKAKRPAAPKLSPTQILSGMLYVNRYDPAENLAQSCKRSDFKGLAVAFGVNAEWIGRAKGEFETTAQFAERTGKLETAVNTNGGVVVCHDLEDNPDALFVYHADEGEYQGGFNLYQNVWRDSKPLGSYATKTRMGVPVTVRAKAEFEYDASFSLFKPEGGCLSGVSHYTFKFPYPIEKAPALRQSGRLVFVASLVRPFVEVHETDGEPTLDDPNDIWNRTITLHMKASRAVIIDGAGNAVWSCGLEG